MPVPRHTEEAVPAACRLEPERLDELPPLEELADEEIEAFDDAQRGAYRGADVVAKCSKLGGYAAWLQGPEAPGCDCGKPRGHYLTIASAQRDERAWGLEDTGLMIADMGALYVLACTDCWTFSFAVQGC
jgi:hypothetical protein